MALLELLVKKNNHFPTPEYYSSQKRRQLIKPISTYLNLSISIYLHMSETTDNERIIVLVQTTPGCGSIMTTP